MTDCKVCDYGPELIDWSLSNVQIGNLVDCSETSVRRHKKHAEDPGLTVGHDFPESPVDGVWVPRRSWQTPQGEVLNSFQFVPDSPESVAAHIDNERIDSLIRDWPFKKLGAYSTPCDMLLPADLQLGKVDAGGGTDGTIQRFLSAIEAGAKRWETLRPHTGVLADLGDLIENMYSAKQQVSTNDRTLPEQIEDAVALYVNAIGRLLPLTENLVVVNVTSNHGEARNELKTNPYTSDNDWGLMIFRLVRGKCEDRGWPVTFVFPAPGEDTAVLELPDGSKVAFNHGHHSGTPAGVKKWITGQIVGRRPGWDADLWVLGHYHHAYFDTLGDGRFFFGTPSLDPGSSWFTKKSGESSPPAIAAMSVADHQWYDFSLLR
jgi:hypothetical protein